jgi:hypothetical protein
VLLFEEGVTLSEQMGDRANIAYCLEGFAVVANARGEGERSGRLIGVAEGLHEAVGVPVYLCITSLTARGMSAQWPPYVRSWARRPSRRRGSEDGR